MSVRKRTWTTPKGETKEAWVVAYVDQFKKGHIRFKKACAIVRTANRYEPVA
jgi:hypothetical protein